jgi:lipid A 4'-phosphatase
VIKKFKIELVIIILLIINFLFSINIDYKIYEKIVDQNNFLNNIFLKKFFIDITKIGDSVWVFLFSFLVYVLCYFFKNKLIKNYRDIYNKVRLGSLFLFTAILVTGLITQIIKHVVGRPRPNHSLMQKSFEFDFFNLNSAFHSFPSGHTSTIFVVALFLSIFTPKIKYYYLFFASLIAFSRVVVSAHFFTDLLGGVVVAFIGFKITLVIFNKLKIKQSLSSIKKLNSNTFLLSLIIILIGIIIISIGNTLDIYISDFFYLGNQQFILQSHYPITYFVRKILLPFLIIYLLILPFFTFFLPINKIYFNYKIKIKEVFFIFFSALFNLLIVVNVVLKNNWGRARPNDIIQLGGKENFTPWFQISDACNTNCSFVSGDASVGFSIIVLFFITKNKIFLWLAMLLGFSLGSIRILEGGHFLSDILIAGFLIFILNYLQFYFFNKKFKKDVS